MPLKYFKVFAACAVLVCLVSFMFLVAFSDQADSSAYGPNAGAPMVQESASGR